MRIALAAPFGMQPKGTVSTRMVALGKALTARGHEVRLIVPPWDDPRARRGGRLAEEVTLFPPPSPDAAPGHLHTITLPLPSVLPALLTLPTGLVREALRNRATARGTLPLHITNPPPLGAQASRWAQVVHVFKPVGYSGVAALLLALRGVPWVLDVDDWEGWGGWADRNPYSPVERLSLTVMEAAIPRLAPAVTAASRTLQARLWSFGLPRRRVFYMPNGISEARYGGWKASQGVRDQGSGVGDRHLTQNHALERSEGSKLKTMPSNEVKGQNSMILLYTRFDTFPYAWPLQVLALVLKSHPTARLLVAGSGFFGEEEKMKLEAGKMGLGDRVTILGRLREEEIPARLAQADIALYPMQDTLINRAKSPVKLLEQMLVGLPIVAHRVGQTSEFLGDAGVLIEAGDIEGMAAAAATLLNSPQQRAALSEKAQQRVWEHFNWDKLVLTAEEAYRLAIGRKVE